MTNKLAADAQVLSALEQVAGRALAERGNSADLRLREDLNVGSLALVTVTMDLCDRYGVDPAELDLASFIGRVNTVGDLIGIVEGMISERAGA